MPYAAAWSRRCFGERARSTGSQNGSFFFLGGCVEGKPELVWEERTRSWPRFYFDVANRGMLSRLSIGRGGIVKSGMLVSVRVPGWPHTTTQDPSQGTPRLDSSTLVAWLAPSTQHPAPRRTHRHTAAAAAAAAAAAPDPLFECQRRERASTESLGTPHDVGHTSLL